MASNSLDSQSIYENLPFLKLTPYTGHYQFRRKFEDSSTGAMVLSAQAGYQRMYYSYQLVRNRLRGVYPTGGRLGMCISLENTRTARYSPYTPSTWPEANYALSLWSPPTLCFSHYSSITFAFNAGLGNFMMIGLGTMVWNVGMTNVHASNDASPPAGFCTDLTGICAFVRNTESHAQKIDFDKLTASPQIGILDAFAEKVQANIVLNNRYDVEPIELNPDPGVGVEDSAGEILPEIRPSGLFWPSKGDAPASGNTFNTSRILPEVETWREMNLFPIGSGGVAIGNFPLDYSKAYDGGIFKGNSCVFVNGETEYEFDGFVYWVTRDGPLDSYSYKTVIENGVEKKKTYVTRNAVILCFEASLTGMQDNPLSRYRSETKQLVGSNSISPRFVLEKPEKLLKPWGLELSGPYNSVFTHMDSPGAPAEDDEFRAKLSEIACHYAVPASSIMSGNVIIDDDMFRRINTSGYVHSHLWSELGTLLRLQHQSQITPGIATNLVALMIHVMSLGNLMSPQYSNDKLGLYLGSLTHSLCHNNPMPEVGVAIGSHRTSHTISLLTSGYTYCVEDEADKPTEAPKDLNQLTSNIPQPIYTYNGFGASPHRIGLLDNGIILIPTDIGILQYNILEKKVICEWLNPTLIPFVSDLLKTSNSRLSFDCLPEIVDFENLPNGSAKYLLLNLHFSVNNMDNNSSYTVHQVDDRDILSVSAEDVYFATSHMGSYGQVTFESSTFQSDLMVLLRR